MAETAKGVMAMVAACVVWGLSPLYYKLIAHVPPLELLAHRTLWSAVFFGVLLGVQGRLSALWGLRSGWSRVALAALMISVNWFVFIWSVQVGRVMEASLGYYIFPLVAVLFGWALFNERLRPGQWIAVAMAGVAVLVLGAGAGAPWVSLVLAVTFGFYGVLKKRLVAGPVVSVTGEVLLLLPLALIWLGFVHLGEGGVFGDKLSDSALLMLSGVITGGPLVLFSYATRRVALATVGVLQYLNPTLQFLCAVVVFAEPFSSAHAVAFPLIWCALVIYSVVALRQERAARKAASAASTVSTL